MFGGINKLAYLCNVTIKTNKTMLNPKVDYKGQIVTVFGTKFESINGKFYRIIGQYPNEQGGLIFELNVTHPDSKKHEPLCIKESECSLIKP